MYVICKIYVPIYIGVMKFKAYFTATTDYTGAYEKTTVVDISVLRSNYHNPQLLVVENYSYLLNLRPNI